MFVQGGVSCAEQIDAEARSLSMIVFGWRCLAGPGSREKPMAFRCPLLFGGWAGSEGAARVVPRKARGQALDACRG